MNKWFVLFMKIFLVGVAITAFILSTINITEKDKVCKADRELKNNKKKYDVPDVPDHDDIIPKKIFQCYKNKEGVPDKVFNNLKNLNPKWEYNFYDDNDCIKFLDKYYGQEYVDKFNGFKSGAHKADLWRYCVLYVYGGVYVDIDLEMLVSFDSIIDYETFITPYSSHRFRKITNTDNIYNALIMTKPKHPIIYDCIQRIMKTSFEHAKKDYHVNVRNMKFAVKNYLKTKKLKTKNYGKTKLLHEYWESLPYKWSIYDYKLNTKIANTKYKNYSYHDNSGVFN